MRFTHIRRLIVALVALLVAAPLFRPEISLALVNRGDDFLYRAQTDRAVYYYRRALALDPDSAVAADRYAFFAQHVNRHANEEEVVRVCTAFLSKREDSAVRSDRALAFLKLHRYIEAQIDFESVATALRDARYLDFAAWSAFHAHRLRDARNLWTAARKAGFHPAGFVSSVAP